MSRHDPITTLGQILDYSVEAVEMVKNYSRSDLDTNRMLNLSLVRLVEVVGESTKRLPDDFHNKYPEFPWRAISGLRNRLIHAYDTIDFDRLWAIIQNDLPPLIEQVKSIIAKES